METHVLKEDDYCVLVDQLNTAKHFKCLRELSDYLTEFRKKCPCTNYQRTCHNKGWTDKYLRHLIRDFGFITLFHCQKQYCTSIPHPNYESALSCRKRKIEVSTFEKGDSATDPPAKRLTMPKIGELKRDQFAIIFEDNDNQKIFNTKEEFFNYCEELKEKCPCTGRKKKCTQNSKDEHIYLLHLKQVCNFSFEFNCNKVNCTLFPHSNLLSAMNCDLEKLNQICSSEQETSLLDPSPYQSHEDSTLELKKAKFSFTENSKDICRVEDDLGNVHHLMDFKELNNFCSVLRECCPCQKRKEPCPGGLLDWKTFMAHLRRDASFTIEFNCYLTNCPRAPHWTRKTALICASKRPKPRDESFRDESPSARKSIRLKEKQASLAYQEKCDEEKVIKKSNTSPARQLKTFSYKFINNKEDPVYPLLFVRKSEIKNLLSDFFNLR